MSNSVICLTSLGVIFPVAKVILRLRRDGIIFAPKTREANFTRRKPNITAEGNITRRSANITEKSLALQVLFPVPGARSNLSVPNEKRTLKCPIFAKLNWRRRDLVFDHVCGARNCSARCRFAQFRPLHPRIGRSSRHRRRSLTRLSCRSPALGQIFLCQIKMHPYRVHFNLAEKERFELSRRLSRPTPLAGAPLRPLEYFSKGCQRSSQN